MNFRKLIITLFVFTFLNNFSQNDTLNHTDSESQKQGYWKNFKETAIVSEGVYLNNKKTGKWTEYYPSGKIKNQIEFKEGRPNGKATMYYENGNVSESGAWGKNRWLGEHLEYYESGKIKHSFNFNENGQRDGKQTYYNEDGSIKCTALFVDGKTDSKSNCFAETEMLIKEASCKEGIVTNPNKYYSRDGKLISEYYKDSLRIEYYGNGNRKLYVRYKNGLLDGETIHYYETEEVSLKMLYKEGKRNGPFSFYYPNGQINYRGEYKNDKMYGERICYNKNGDLVNGDFVFYQSFGKYMCKYINGRPEGEMKVYDSQGNLTMSVEFQNGKPHGAHTHYYNGTPYSKVDNYINGEFVK